MNNYLPGAVFIGLVIFSLLFPWSCESEKKKKICDAISRSDDEYKACIK